MNQNKRNLQVFSEIIDEMTRVKYKVICVNTVRQCGVLNWDKVHTL